MVFDLIYQLRTKKFWWLDTILYFTLALLVATVICYFIFNIKISFQGERLEELKDAILTTGTPQQKTLETEVFKYQKKINDFSILLAAHKTSSSFFNFIEQSTFPKVWFSEVSLDTNEPKVRLVGESENTQVLARQISFLKESEFIKDIKLLNLSLEEEGKIKFSLVFSLNPQMFK